MRRNGAQRVVLNLINNFIGSGISVVLVNDYKLPDDVPQYEIDASVKRFFFLEEKKSFVRSNVYRIKCLRSIIKQEAPDVCLSFTGRANIRMVWAALFLRCKVVVSVRNDPKKEYGDKIINRLFANAILGLADACVFQTEEQKKYFSNKINKNSSVIINPVSSSFYEPGKGDSKRNIINIGRLEKQKNQELLIRAFKNIIDLTDENLYIYGEGSLENFLIELIDELGISDRVHIYPPVKDVKEVIRKSKLFVLSSDYEGLPNVLLEAMALGTACISTDFMGGGVQQIFEGYKDVIVERDNEDALSNIMLKILNDDEKRKSVENTMSRLSEKYKDSVICEKWIRFLFENI